MVCFPRNCFSCFGWTNEEETNPRRSSNAREETQPTMVLEISTMPTEIPVLPSVGTATAAREEPQPTAKTEVSKSSGEEKLGSTSNKGESSGAKDGIDAHASVQYHVFTFQELADMTNNFTSESYPRQDVAGIEFTYITTFKNQVVTITRMDKDLVLRSRADFVMMASKLKDLKHPNLVNLIGHCTQGAERLLVHEYPRSGTLQEQFHNRPQRKYLLEWKTRMRIAAGVARGLQYLHEEAGIIYEDLRPCNILLDKWLQPKLSHFGFAKLVENKDAQSLAWRRGVYCANECFFSGRVSKSSDIYSFGVLLLELIAGRMASDWSQQWPNLVILARNVLQHYRRYTILVDPRLQRRYNKDEVIEALQLGMKCIQDEAAKRPSISAVVKVLCKFDL